MTVNQPSGARFASLAAALSSLCCTQPAWATPLNPFNFSSLGVLELTSGQYTIDTGDTDEALPVIKDAGGAVLKTGVNYDQQVPQAAPYWGYNPRISVFSFDDLRIGADASVSVVGRKPVSLLSRTTIEVLGTLDASGSNGANAQGTPPGNQGGNGDGQGGRGGAGGGRGGDGGTPTNPNDPTTSKGGNGFGPGNAAPVILPGTREIGGYGGTGGLSTRGNGAGFGGRAGGGFGGLVPASTYGDDLLTYLQGGAGGGGTGNDTFLSVGAGGGGGGGAIELGAIETITLETQEAEGKILATGGGGGGGGTALAGGGSGGGLRIQGNQIIGGLVNASAGGNNGGGGRIALLTATGASVQSLGVTASVNPGTVFGEPGTIGTGVQQMQAAADNIVAAFTTGSPASLTRTLAGALPGAPFDLSFATLFETTTGILEVFLDGFLLGQFAAPAVPDTAFVTRTLGVDPSGFPGTSHTLAFLFDGPTGSRLLLDDVVFPGLSNGGFQTGLSPWLATGPGDVSLRLGPTSDAVVPAPQTWALLLAGLAYWRGRVQVGRGAWRR